MLERHTPAPPSESQPHLSMLDAYDGYVLTQHSHAMADAVMLERALRAVALCVAAAVVAAWTMSGVTVDSAATILKAALSLVLIALSGGLLWIARALPRFETQIDLIHCELRQVMRTPGRGERRILCVALNDVASVFVDASRDGATASCLFARLRDCDEPVLLGLGDLDSLLAAERRIAADLHTARLGGATGRRAASGPANHGLQPA